ncbi:hypothetical protein HK100_012626 [Physocladia obscura]|uniref:Methyltransferase domain-containing protein n=1 Tax=Physocladia obscura TaxID=109957 RepID=A0AAD5SZL5_9FUNG|nr:hypothetical protein HK100_012626 [Physocladia obscura]
MGPEHSKTTEEQSSQSVHAEIRTANSQSNNDPSTNSIQTIQDARVDKLQAKVWNPNTPESWEAGMREYHSVETSDYPLPSDEIEQNRLETGHFVFRARFQGDIICPDAKELVKSDGTKVLDVGCAKGFWLQSVRKDNPFSEYHGVDIAERFVTEASGNGSINIKFGNVLERLPYEDNTFDYVHQRLLVLGMPKDKFPDALKELIRVTKPGGWIELVEGDIVIYKAGPYSTVLTKAILDAMHARGLDCYAATNLEWYVNKVASNVANQGIRAIHNIMNDGTPLGKLMARVSKESFLSMEDWLHKPMNLTRGEYQKLVDNCAAEWEEYQSFWQNSAVYFQVVK